MTSTQNAIAEPKRGSVTRQKLPAAQHGNFPHQVSVTYRNPHCHLTNITLNTTFQLPKPIRPIQPTFVFFTQQTTMTDAPVAAPPAPDGTVALPSNSATATLPSTNVKATPNPPTKQPSADEHSHDTRKVTKKKPPNTTATPPVKTASKKPTPGTASALKVTTLAMEPSDPGDRILVDDPSHRGGWETKLGHHRRNRKGTTDNPRKKNSTSGEWRVSVYSACVDMNHHHRSTGSYIQVLWPSLMGLLRTSLRIGRACC